jgi:hypothetical protein
MPAASTGYEVVSAPIDNTAPITPTILTAPSGTFIVNAYALDDDGNMWTVGDQGSTDITPTFTSGKWTSVSIHHPGGSTSAVAYIVCVGG